MFMDVKFGKGVKDGHIAIADGDVPAVLAANFCRVYSLDANTERNLTALVLQNMRSQNIQIGRLAGGAHDSGAAGASKTAATGGDEYDMEIGGMEEFESTQQIMREINLGQLLDPHTGSTNNNIKDIGYRF